MKAQARFREFIRNFRNGPLFPYREQLRQRYHKKENELTVNLGDLNKYDPHLQTFLQADPRRFIAHFEKAAQDVLQQLSVDLAADQEPPPIQVTLSSAQACTALREVSGADMYRLVKIPGIVVSASTVRAKAQTVVAKCKDCGHIHRTESTWGIANIPLPRFCDAGETAGQRCSPEPFVVDATRGTYVDTQTLKLQESPEVVPTGEMPRSIICHLERGLVDRVPPGTRVSVIAVTACSRLKGGRSGVQDKNVKDMYLQVVGVQVDAAGAGRAAVSFTPSEEEQFHSLARDPDIYEKLASSIAPSISGDYTHDIKKAIACLLFGGSRKVLPDGMRLRGDINVLMLGDPSTAKSQFLKFVEKVAPIGVYTSGKGSSAAGLTASVVRDRKGEFYLEGGAMVLADGGVVCIDEFDKMRESDRVAIHEAMEQQTISIAKAGITTVLNSRSSVLAAANPLYGRYDDLKSAAENIDLMSTILSRFDMIFIVRDVREEGRDMAIARHVMGVHMNAGATDAAEGEIDIGTFKKFIQYCRLRCAPRLSEDAALALRNQYVAIREEVRRRTQHSDDESAVPITVRQLEALIRISEALAKMSLSQEATVEHVSEALRLFKVSSLSASNGGGNGPGAGDSFMKPELRKEVDRVEEQLRRRIMIGSAGNTRQIQEQFVAMGFSDFAVRKAIQVLVQRGEFMHRNQRRILHRLK